MKGAEIYIEILLDMLLEELDRFSSVAKNKEELYKLMKDRLKYLHTLAREKKIELLRQALGIL